VSHCRQETEAFWKLIGGKGTIPDAVPDDEEKTEQQQQSSLSNFTKKLMKSVLALSSSSFLRSPSVPAFLLLLLTVLAFLLQNLR
jgi:hypothetical protein